MFDLKYFSLSSHVHGDLCNEAHEKMHTNFIVLALKQADAHFHHFSHGTMKLDETIGTRKNSSAAWMRQGNFLSGRKNFVSLQITQYLNDSTKSTIIMSRKKKKMCKSFESTFQWCGRCRFYIFTRTPNYEQTICICKIVRMIECGVRRLQSQGGERSLEKRQC